MENVVTCIDAVMGAGKTTMIIEKIKNNPTEKYIYVGVLISEMQRIQKSLPELKFKQPERDFENNTKKESLLSLLTNNENIVTSHSLLRQYDDDFKELLKDYTIILDEELQVADSMPIKKGVRRELFDHNKIFIDDSGKVQWNEKDYPIEETYDEDIAIRQLAKSGSLYYSEGDFFIWVMPPSLFMNSKKVYVISYLIEGSLLHGYFEANNIKYEFDKSLKFREDKIRKKSKDLIEIVDIKRFESDTKLRTIVSQPNAFGYNFLKNKISIKYKKQITEALRNWLQTNNIKSDRVISTTYKELSHSGIQKNIQGMGIRSYIKTWVYPKCRATNMYADKDVVIYGVNLFPNVGVEKYLNKVAGFSVNRSNYALANALQFIYRSAIRNDKPIKLIVPSVKIKNLIINWMEVKSWQKKNLKKNHLVN